MSTTAAGALVRERRLRALINGYPSSPQREPARARAESQIAQPCPFLSAVGSKPSARYRTACKWKMASNRPATAASEELSFPPARRERLEQLLSGHQAFGGLDHLNHTQEIGEHEFPLASSDAGAHGVLPECL